MTLVEHAGISEQGNVRAKNDDSIGFTVPTDPAVLARKGCLFVVADGVGGHGAGDVASHEAVKVLTETYYASRSKPERSLKTALGRANIHVFDLGVATNRFNMSTTVSAIAIVGSRFFIVHVGDSRIYRVRQNTEIVQLTTDHSEVAELVRMNILSPDKVRNHPRRSLITRSVGSQTIVHPMVASGEVVVGDKFVMCTDGIWEPVQDNEFSDIVRAQSPQDACKSLIGLGLERQSTDNLSAMVVHVTDVAEDAVRNSQVGWWGKILLALSRPN
jgi:protein phosphatase